MLTSASRLALKCSQGRCNLSLFQADDREFKAELGRIVEMDAWDAAKLVAAEQLRAARHRALQLEQELSVRSAYLAGLDAKVG